MGTSQGSKYIKHSYADIISKKNLYIIENHISGIEYGSVTVKIHNNKIVFIEKKEKVKIGKPR
ncbi:MAG: YezD family protein [Clostridiales Family XIII bacterium]|jgi:hypothetical protein|nr:YezD family protein [Clostridiales Family XIII bacterium]